MIPRSKKIPASNYNWIKYLSIFFPLLITLFFISCGDDPVTPVNPEDTVLDTLDMYDWSLDTIEGHVLNNIYVADSNSIFMTGNGNTMLYYNGKSFSEFNYAEPNFSAYCISGYSKDNIFVGGGTYTDPGPSRLSLEVWNGSMFSVQNFPNDTSYQVDGAYVLGYGEAWLKTAEHSVFHYNNGISQKYEFDSLLGAGYFYKTENNTLYFFANREYLYTSVSTGYKFVNNSFQKIYSDFSNMTNELGPSISIFGNDAMRWGRAVYYFQNENWSKLCNFNVFTGSFGGLTGSSKDYLVVFGASTTYEKNMYIWKDKKWHIEKNYCNQISYLAPFIAHNSHLHLVNGIVYMLYRNSYVNQVAYLLRGKLKNIRK